MAWPLYQLYLGRWYQAAKVLYIRPSAGGDWEAVNLAAGKYYLVGTSAESGIESGTYRLAQYLEDQLNASAYLSDTTVTFSQSTGLFTIDFGSDGNTDIDWTSAPGLQAAMGYTGSQTSASSYVATNQARYQWRPSEPLSEYTCGDLLRWWNRKSRTIVHIANEGSASVTKRAMHYDGTYTYSLLPKADVVTIDGTTVWESLEQFFEDVANEGEPFRCYPDRTLSSATYVFEAILPGGENGVGGFDQFFKASIQGWDGLMDVTLSLRKYLAAG